MLNSLQAKSMVFISSKIALKMIDKKDITFISLDNSSLKIKKSKNLEIKTLKTFNLFGNMPCSPFYVCSKKVEKYFSSLGIARGQRLVLYDASYGIDASTLYVILESMGHKRISILRGGVKDISQLDPNWKIYTNYLKEITLNDDIEKLKKIMQKMDILKPHLLLQDNNVSNSENIENDYVIRNKSTDYLLSKQALKEAVRKVRSKESNITIIDACEMIDIVGSDNGSYLSGIKPLSWKKLIDKKKKHLKSNEELEKLFMKLELNKNDKNYIYCMSGAQKAFYVMMVLRELGYSKVKAFSGDWNTWVGDIGE
jgi:3-mercaptopyruvate sulfurtransferase SseA